MTIGIDRVKSVIGSFRNKRVAVVGDLILDCYVWGKVTRISPEAPVPIVHATKKTYALGGAANVTRNIASLGGKAYSFGALGKDPAGDTLRELLASQTIDTANAITEGNGRVTIEKQRVIAASQQLVRVDYEDLSPVSDEIRKRLSDRLIAMISAGELDAVIFEDYAKGLLNNEMTQPVLDAAAKRGVITALDPNPRNKLSVKGLDLMTPNLSEALALSKLFPADTSFSELSDADLNSVAAKLRQDWDVKKVLITLGSKGMALYENGLPAARIPTRAKEVFDVTGAGDTVIATYVMASLGGADGREAAEISNHAAGIVVGKIGAAAVTPDELTNAFRMDQFEKN